MSIFKITNITNLANKRDSKHNTVLDIDYVDNMSKKKIIIKPGCSVYLTVSSLPISIHRLRVKNLIIVDEISSVELSEVIANDSLKPNDSLVSKEIPNENFDDEIKKQFKKKIIKKEDE